MEKLLGDKRRTSIQLGKPSLETMNYMILSKSGDFGFPYLFGIHKAHGMVLAWDHKAGGNNSFLALARCKNLPPIPVVRVSTGRFLADSNGLLCIAR